VEGGLLLDVVVGQGAAVLLELLAGEDEAQLVGRDAPLVLELLLHLLNRVARLDLERDGMARESLHEYLRCWFVLLSSTMPNCWLGRRFA
jgi:hypothetical protein